MALTGLSIEVRAESDLEEVPCYLAHPEQPACGFFHRRVVAIRYYVNGKLAERETWAAACERLQEEARGY